MARLPDETALGGAPIGASGRPIATFDTTGYSRGAEAEARGAAAMGEGAKALGVGLTSAGGKVADVARMWDEDENKLELARGKSVFLTGKIDTDVSFKDDQDHATFQNRYGTQIDKVAADATSQIVNPRTRELFQLSIADDVAKAKAAAGDQANKLWKDNTVADTLTKLDANRQAGLTTTDPNERMKLTDNSNFLIDGLADKNIITRETAVLQKKKWAEDFTIGKLSMLPPVEQIKELNVPRVGAEGGTPMQVAGQFIGAHEVKNRDTLAAFLNKAGGAKLDPATTAWCARFVNSVLYDTGLKGTGSDMAKSFLNYGTATDKPSEGDIVVLSRGDPNGPQGHVGFYAGPGSTPGTIKVLAGNTNNSVTVAEYPEGKVLGYRAISQAPRDAASQPAPALGSFLPEDTRVRLLRQAEAGAQKEFTTQSAAKTEQYERSIIDASAGIGSLPARSSIENDPSLDEPRRNTLLRQYDSAAGDVVGLQNFMNKFKDPNGGAFNPYDTEERKYVDKAFNALGADAAALQSVVSRTGIVPKSAAAQLRGSIVSNDPKRVADALTLSSNLINANPNAFVGVDGKKDFEDNAVAFRHYVDDLGMTADDAAKKIIQAQSPEYQAMKAKIKPEDIDAKIKKDLSINDLAGAFDQVPWIPFTDPKVGFDPKQRLEMYSQYAEGVKEHYLENGDWNLAKKQAANDLKKTWGVSSINGSQTVMQYPPERAPAYAGVADPAAAISKQAIEAVKIEAGTDIDRKSIKLQPIPGVTAQAYKSGQPVPYMLMWTDKENVVHMLNPGRAFVADPVQMKDAQSDQRRNDLEKRADEAGPLLDIQATRKAQQQASRRALAGQDTSAEVAARLPPVSDRTLPGGIPADSPEARGLPGGAEVLKKNVGAVVDTIKKQPLIY